MRGKMKAFDFFGSVLKSFWCWCMNNLLDFEYHNPQFKFEYNIKWMHSMFLFVSIWNSIVWLRFYFQLPKYVLAVNKCQHFTSQWAGIFDLYFVLIVRNNLSLIALYSQEKEKSIGHFGWFNQMVGIGIR